MKVKDLPLPSNFHWQCSQPDNISRVSKDDSLTVCGEEGVALLPGGLDGTLVRCRQFLGSRPSSYVGGIRRQLVAATCALFELDDEYHVIGFQDSFPERNKPKEIREKCLEKITDAGTLYDLHNDTRTN